MTAETRLLDYSEARPSPAAIKKAGAVGVMRYLAVMPNPKVLTADEARRLHAGGLLIGLVFETTAQRAAQGAAAGRADRTLAEQEARNLGYPHECPIFYAVDFDATPGQVSSYFAALRQANGSHPVGIYGGVKVMAVAADAYWQTAAWSSGQLSGRAHLYQRAKREGRYVSGTDENVVCRPIRLWGPEGAVMVLPGVAKPAKHHIPPHVGAALFLLRRWLRRAHRKGWTLAPPAVERLTGCDTEIKAATKKEKT